MDEENYLYLFLNSRRFLIIMIYSVKTTKSKLEKLSTRKNTSIAKFLKRLENYYLSYEEQTFNRIFHFPQFS